MGILGRTATGRLIATILVTSTLQTLESSVAAFTPVPQSAVTYGALHRSTVLANRLEKQTRGGPFVFQHRNDVSQYAAASATDASLVAQGLGYLVAAGSFSLYTPIALRLVKQKSASGLTQSTWWIKLASYTCSDVYAFSHGYPLSTWAETLVITVQALVILLLVSYFQESLEDTKFWAIMAGYCIFAYWLLSFASPDTIALGQASSATLNVIALLPQFRLNFEMKTAGDYSPITAGLASAGCLIRLFTTVQLADSDPILLGTYGVALLVNASLLAQILYYGVKVQRRSLVSVLIADLGGESLSSRDDSTAKKVNPVTGSSRSSRTLIGQQERSR